MTGTSRTEELLRKARLARQNAYAPYSGHAVGAALASVEGGVYSGCNVENVSSPLGTCAEQAAICAMVLAGDSAIREIVVVGPDENPCTPCGACRQRMKEFAAPDMIFHAASDTRLLLSMSMDELLPHAFGPNLKNLDNDDDRISS